MINAIKRLTEILFALRNLGYRLPKYEERLLLIDMITLKNSQNSRFVSFENENIVFEKF